MTSLRHEGPVRAHISSGIKNIVKNNWDIGMQAGEGAYGKVFAVAAMTALSC